MARPLSSGFLATRLIAAAEVSPWKIALFHSTIPVASPMKKMPAPAIGVVAILPAIRPHLSAIMIAQMKP